MTISSSESSGYTTGLRDMLTTAMVQSKRYRVLECQNMDSLKSEMALTGFGGSGGMGGGLGGYAKTPMEKAIRTCLYNATKFIAENTPQEYMKY
jgi:curli biogenesis system outer membrane secretion channel CsgG